MQTDKNFASGFRYINVWKRKERGEVMSDHYDRYNGMDKLSTNLAEVGTDCISRQAAIETFKDCAVNGVGIDGIVDALEQLPSIQPKRGKWIDKGVYTYVDDHRHLYKCDQCGNGWLDTPDFCPNCGADMRGEQNG